MKKLNACLTLVACLGFIVSISSAQINTASLTGLVTDSSGAVVDGARVVTTNIATNVEQSATTSSGYYTFPTLPVGNYQINVEKPGFRKAVTAVTLDVGQKGRQDFTF